MRTSTIVAIMNFLVWGSGYLYLRKAWGFWIVLIDVLISATIGLRDISLAGWLLLVVISILFAWHGYAMAKKEEAKVKRKRS